ncbi:hypothetical protein P152DRAFT_396641 [Eremomyces bilateralis CBS 781.70]|uniref:Uncharacterized protein n=1 Tax=Eremomyces bilateralis CBS 781.70 TaxID=1392243 RepID=A0A6G1G3R6_9PEZI|nr:uncharacterized protein P152DRAFT_396641 [Eremomyces bilateralis CBS 781.70]KAF1812622.1 hypothetical protein P152DRAFT_396641 [Eremomyces bilateralis CBS 781.70]
MAPPSPNLDSQGLLPTEVRRTESRSPARPATTSLPRCPRGEFSSRYDDWYILDSFPEFDVCPSCLDQIIDRTMPELCRYFKRAPRRPSGTATRCDFNNPWVRLAWLLTLQNSRPKIDLLDDVAHIYASGERCPGESEVSGSWYGLLDGDRLIGDFAVCPVDRKVLETLFPSLKGQFTRLSTSDPRRRRCATRVGSRWYAALLDAFVEMDSKAGSRSGKVDLKPLLELLRTTSASSTSSSSASSSTNHPPQTPDPSPKCARDTLVLNRHWHIIPSLPELTVCPTCYADVIRPALHSGSRLASSFTRTPLLLPDPSLSSSVFFRPPSSTQGASCQLYSPRMRRVWAKAVAGGDDFEYLARRARERRKVEAAVQGQHASLVRLMEQRGREAVSPRLAEERFEREWKEVLREWKEWE